MRKRMKLSRPSHATVVAYLALFVALGGSAYAVKQLPKNSVGTKQLKKNAVTRAKIKKNSVVTAKIKGNAVTGAKVDESTLGTVPTAQTADSLAPPEASHEVGAPGQPQFQNSWHNAPSAPTVPETVGFYKDRAGVVHLKGHAESGIAPVLFQLPSGYRPASGRVLDFAAICDCGAATTGGVFVFGAGTSAEGEVMVQAGATSVSLDGIAFRAES